MNNLLQCPHCGSKHLSKQGWYRDEQQVYLCKQCRQYSHYSKLYKPELNAQTPSTIEYETLGEEDTEAFDRGDRMRSKNQTEEVPPPQSAASTSLNLEPTSPTQFRVGEYVFWENCPSDDAVKQTRRSMGRKICKEVLVLLAIEAMLQRVEAAGGWSAIASEEELRELLDN